jgi:hypothetical protein
LTVLGVDIYEYNTHKSIQTSILRVDTYIRYYTWTDTTLLCLVHFSRTKKFQTKKYYTDLLIQRIPTLQLQATKNRSRKHSTTESDSEVTPTRQAKKKVFSSEHIGQSKSTEDKTTDANTSTNSTVKHWQRNFQPRVAHQPITSSLRKSGYRSGF